MYEVMARRYRPAVFDEVIGQEHIAATLRNAIVRDRVSHAYIFTGGHGCGKTTMARILAKSLVCEKGPTADPCGVCPICVDVAAGRDADVLEIDGASNNGIEQIRQLREQAAYVPTRARFKIYIIDEVHMLSDGAFNALLKTLEEPPRHVKFILATTDPHKVPDTILSRCQRFDFRLVPQARLAEFFKTLAGREQAEIDPEALEAVAAFAEGSVRDGLVLLDQLLSFADGAVSRRDVEAVRGVASAENVAGIFSRVARSDVRGALAIVDEVASRGTNVGDFLDQLVMFGRDLMLLAATGSPEGLTAYGPAREALEELGAITSLEKALLYLDVLTQARTRVRSRALSNPLVALEMAVARLAGLGGVTPIADILAALESLPAAEAARPAEPPPVPKPEPARPDAAPAADRPVDRPPPPETVPAAPEPAPEPEPEPAVAVLAEVAPEPDYYDDDEPDLDAVRQAVPAPLDLERALPLWERMLDDLGDKHPADLRHLSRVKLEGVRGDALVLAGSPTALEAWEDKHRLARLKEAAATFMGRPVSFEFVPRQARRDPREQDETRYRLSRHPAVDQVKTLFDGVIVDFKANAADADADSDNEENP